MPGTSATAERAYHGTITANNVDTICIVNPWPTLTIVNRGTSEIYFTVGSSQNPPTPAVLGTVNSFVLPSNNGAAVTIITPQEYLSPPQGVVVSLISSGSPQYSVEAI